MLTPRPPRRLWAQVETSQKGQSLWCHTSSEEECGKWVAALSSIISSIAAADHEAKAKQLQRMIDIAAPLRRLTSDDPDDQRQHDQKRILAMLQREGEEELKAP